MILSTTRRVKPYQQRRILRDIAIANGVDPIVAGQTAPDDLAAVIRLAPQLRLVLDVDDADEPLPCRVTQMLHEGHTPDEIASLETYLSGTLVELHPVAADYTPWDEYTGGDAA